MRLILPALILIAACAQFPELDSRASSVPANAPYPELVPTEMLLAGLPEADHGQTVTRGLAGRAAALRARAARLRARPVIDRETRAALQASIARHSR